MGAGVAQWYSTRLISDWEVSGLNLSRNQIDSKSKFLSCGFAGGFWALCVWGGGGGSL